MSNSSHYVLNWNAIPMGALKEYRNWYLPYLGQGLYMYVLSTSQDRAYTVYYVGKSQDIGRRWYEHVFNDFLDPNEGFSVPKNVSNFLNNPVDVINNGEFAQGLPNRREIHVQMLEATWFCYAEINRLNSGDMLEHLEYVLQEGVKTHIGITENGWIGDTVFRPKSQNSITITNNIFRDFLKKTLPSSIRYDRLGTITID